MDQVLLSLASMSRHEEQVTRAFEHSRGDVYRYLLTLGLSPPHAQEATQEVFMRLFIALENGDVIQNERAWIFRVAHNLGLDGPPRSEPSRSMRKWKRFSRTPIGAQR